MTFHPDSFWYRQLETRLRQPTRWQRLRQFFGW